MDKPGQQTFPDRMVMAEHTAVSILKVPTKDFMSV